MESQKDYMERRACEEDAAADRAASDKARELHFELATRYRNAAISEPKATEAESVSSTRPKEFRILE